MSVGQGHEDHPQEEPELVERPRQPGSIDNVTVQWESSPSTTVQLIEKGAANFATEWSIDNALSVGKHPGFTLKRYRAYNTDPVIAFNQAKPPYDNKLVRQAFQYAFDYKAMRAYFHNYAQPTTECCRRSTRMH